MFESSNVQTTKLRTNEIMNLKILVVVMLCLNALSAGAAKNESMELVPSVWGAWMRGNVVVNGQNAKIGREADNYFEDLSLGGSAELILRNKKMVLLGSVDYFDNILSDVTVGSKTGTLETTEIIGCIAIGYPLAPPSRKMNFDLLVGLQGLRMDNALKLDGDSPENARTDVFDTVMMLRIKMMLGNKLYLNIPLSLGGIYLGESELVYDVGAQLLYKVTDKFDVRAGYRISGYEYQEDANNKWDFYQQGFTLGLGIAF
jgi:hypothetical protein